MAKPAQPRQPFHQAMANLIKTVRGDAPTVLLGQGSKGKEKGAKAAKTAGYRPKSLPNKPRVLALGSTPAARRTPASPLLKGKSTMKSAKSRFTADRRPMFAIALALFLVCSGAYLYHHLSMPKVHVKHVATQWLDHSAGKTRHVVHHQVTHYQGTTFDPHPASAVPSPAGLHHSRVVQRPVAAVSSHGHRVLAKHKHAKKHPRAVVAHGKVRKPVQTASYTRGE